MKSYLYGVALKSFKQQSDAQRLMKPKRTN